MLVMNSAFGIYRGFLLPIIFVILIAFVSAVPSPQGIPAHQKKRGRPQDVRLPCEFRGYPGFLVKRWQCDDRARKGTCLCAAVAETDPLHTPFLANGQRSPDVSTKNPLDYDECCMQILCIKDDTYNPTGRFSCMDTTSMLSPSLCYSGKGVYLPNLCPNLPGNIQCCTEPPPQRDPFQPMTFNTDSGVNDYTDFNDLPHDYYEETSWQ